MEDKKLYPMRLLGTELGYMDTIIGGGWLGGTTLDELMELYMDRVTGEDVFRWYGLLFPVQMRCIKTGDGLPLMVHPGDDVAQARFDSLGKEKWWYVLKAGKGARLHLGLKNDCEASVVWEAMNGGQAASLLNTVIPHAGEYYQIPSGTIHGAEGELELIEVSQSSELDFHLPEMLEDAFDFIDFHKYRPGNGEDGKSLLMQLPQFSVSRLALREPMLMRGAITDSYVLIYALDGAFRAVTENGESTEVPENGILLVPAEVGDYNLAPVGSGCTLLAVTTEHREESDDITYQGDPDSDDDKVTPGKAYRVS